MNDEYGDDAADGKGGGDVDYRSTRRRLDVDYTSSRRRLNVDEFRSVACFLVILYGFKCVCVFLIYFHNLVYS